MTDEERTVAAGEYVLGTLPPSERAAFAAEIAVDRRAASEVRFWERALGPLVAGVAPEAPPASVWTGIVARIGPMPVANDAGTEPDALARRVGFWRGGALAASLAAAALLAWNIARPPEVVRVAGPTVVREVPAPPAPPALRSVVTMSEGTPIPAVLLTIDEATGEVFAQPVNLDAPSGRVFQLWWKAEGADQVRSVGLLDPAEGRRFRLTRGAKFDGTLFGISIEPPGGSPTGQPTGPVPYHGFAVRLPQS